MKPKIERVARMIAARLYMVKIKMISAWVSEGSVLCHYLDEEADHYYEIIIQKKKKSELIREEFPTVDEVLKSWK